MIWIQLASLAAITLGVMAAFKFLRSFLERGDAETHAAVVAALRRARRKPRRRPVPTHRRLPVVSRRGRQS